MIDRYQIKVAVSPTTRPVDALESVLKSIPFDGQLHSVVPYCDRYGTQMFLVIIEPLK